MKIFKLPLLLLFIGIVLFSCKKDVKVPADRQSYGSLKDSLGNCTPAEISGGFDAGVTLLSESYVDIHVQVDSVGRFDIVTDTVNGFSFEGKSVLGYRGDNRVRLYAHGKPVSGGTNIFTVKYNGDVCNFEIKVGGTVIPPAVYSLDTASGNCSGAVVDGTFSTNIPATGANKVTLKVNVKTPGLYTINTPKVNGISFSGTGSFTGTGAQTVVLKASGTPTAEGSFNYSVSSGTTCLFSVNTVKGPDAAVFTLGGAPGSCSGFAANGTYKAGTALTSSNTVTCQVNVTAIGVYSITTNTVNGITFSKAGTFTSTGSQSVTLDASGTPTAAGTNNFTATAGTGSCTFSITTAAASGGGGGGTVTASTYYLQFNDGTKLIAADTANIVAMQIPNSGYVSTSIQAFSVTGDTTFSIGVTTSGNPKVGVSYVTSTIGTPLTLFSVMTLAGQIYSADFSTPSQVMTIKFDAIDNTNKFISGTFTGKAKTSTGTATITNGKFKAQIQ